jgi:ABC-type antimicrobial peptide transport system permease subunit
MSGNLRRSLPWVGLLPGGLLGVVAGGIVGFVIAAEAVTPRGAAPHETARIGWALVPWYLLGGVVGAFAGGLLSGVLGWFGGRRLARKESPT